MLGTLNEKSREVTIVGAGIAGLLAAYELDKKGYEVTLLEAEARAGGLIQTKRNQYGMSETAAHSLLASPAVVELCKELGVELSEIKPDSRARFIVRDGRLRKFPLSVGEAISAMRRAAFARAASDEKELSLDAWGRTHLGDAAVEYLLTPFVRGIYGIQPAELGVEAAFPMLSVAPGQTLLGAMLGKAFHHPPKKESVNGAPKKKERKRMVAPRHGMGDVTRRLEEHLQQRLGARFRKGVRVNEIPDAPNVIIATPAYSAAELLDRSAPELADELRAITYTPIVSVTAFVPVEAFAQPVRGVGALVPAKEGRKSLGVLFTSSSFEGRVNDDGSYVSFTILFGGSAQPEWAEASDEKIAAAVREELAELLGMQGDPIDLVVNRWPRAIPQYSTALPRVWQRARETWCKQPGRILFGNYTGQVSLRGMIETAADMGRF